MYVGRIQINLNGGKKRKYLYFQADYKLKIFSMGDDSDTGDDDDGGGPDGSGT